MDRNNTTTTTTTPTIFETSISVGDDKLSQTDKVAIGYLLSQGRRVVGEVAGGVVVEEDEEDKQVEFAIGGNNLTNGGGEDVVELNRDIEVTQQRTHRDVFDYITKHLLVQDFSSSNEQMKSSKDKLQLIYKSTTTTTTT
eukprot:GHVS01097357.1.p1 GENE.GHVS01097357.1~~GHVS01097357.1.p1  ORF type:complete len:140 (-),score=57.23 GHVS01097357.1:158-577(-)